MGVVAVVILGILQGLTEFLPVSSSAHLILARAFFGWEVPDDFGLAFDVALHVGTLAAILTFFHREIAAMLRTLPAALSLRPLDPFARLTQCVGVGTLPVVVVGLLFNDYVERVLRTPLVAAVALASGAALMFATERLGPRERSEDSVSWADAIWIGCAQASALIPGVSRSGSTIAIGMLMGLRRDAAARFTFLLAIPATIAAAGKEGYALSRMNLSVETLQLMALGVVVSAAVGYATIKYFLQFLAGHRLDVFAYYRWALAALTFAWIFLR